MSQSVKLVLMGVAGAALLYSCSPGVSAGLGALPYLWFLPNPFYRPPVTAPCPPGQVCQQQSTTGSTNSGGSRGGSSFSSSRSGSTTDASRASPTSSQRGGFGSTGSSGSS